MPFKVTHSVNYLELQQWISRTWRRLCMLFYKMQQMTTSLRRELLEVVSQMQYVMGKPTINRSLVKYCSICRKPTTSLLEGRSQDSNCFLELVQEFGQIFARLNAVFSHQLSHNNYRSQQRRLYQNQTLQDLKVDFRKWKEERWDHLFSRNPIPSLVFTVRPADLSQSLCPIHVVTRTSWPPTPHANPAALIVANASQSQFPKKQSLAERADDEHQSFLYSERKALAFAEVLETIQKDPTLKNVVLPK